MPRHVEERGFVADESDRQRFVTAIHSVLVSRNFLGWKREEKRKDAKLESKGVGGTGMRGTSLQDLR